MAPGPSSAKSIVGERKQLSLAALERTQVRRLLAQGKPGKSQGESELSPGDSSQAFPGCFASGLAAFAPQPQSSQVRFMRTLLVSADFTFGRASATGGCRRFIRARSITASSLAVSRKRQRKVAFSPSQAISAIAGPGRSPPWSGLGRTAPACPFRYLKGSFID